MIVVSTWVSKDGVIGLNGKLFLLDENNQIMEFDNETEARQFLSDHGVDPDSEDIEYELEDIKGGIA
tara:strand:- start:430 stop:630 length:201 start_codon:yes stop_codon:yes gene_type:complete